MKKLIKFVACSMLAVVLGVGAITAMHWHKRTVWPQFPETKNGAPSVVVQEEPDFSWRTGDRVPVTIFIKQPPHTEVDVSSFVAVGDFEKGEMRVFSRETKDGTTYIRVDLTAQSLVVKPKLTLQGTMSYSLESSNDSQSIDIGPADFYTSMTWDGRPNIKDGPMLIDQEKHWLITGSCLLLGLIGTIWCLVLLGRYESSEAPAIVLTPWQEARRDFEFAWEKIALGDDSEENYKEIERIMRKVYRVETRTLSEIEFELGSNHPHLEHIFVIMGNCNKVLYQRMVLNMQEKQDMRAAFEAILTIKKAIPPKLVGQRKPTTEATGSVQNGQ